MGGNPKGESQRYCNQQAQDKAKSNLHSEEDFNEKIKNLDPRLQKLLKTYEEVFGAHALGTPMREARSLSRVQSGRARRRR